MIKRLVKNGSSSSFVIDKPTMRELRLDPDAFVRYRIVGRQLIIEADRYSEPKTERRTSDHGQESRPPLPAMELVIHRLTHEGFGPPEAERLGYRGRFWLFAAHAASGRLDEKHNRVLRALLARRDAQPNLTGKSWEQIVDAVKAEYGDLSDALGNTGS